MGNRWEYQIYQPTGYTEIIPIENPILPFPGGEYFDAHCNPNSPTKCMPFERHIKKCGNCSHVEHHPQINCECNYCDEYCTSNYYGPIGSIPKGISVRLEEIVQITPGYESLVLDFIPLVTKDFLFDHFFISYLNELNYFAEYKRSEPESYYYQTVQFSLFNGRLWGASQRFSIYTRILKEYLHVNIIGGINLLPEPCSVLEDGTKLPSKYRKIFFTFAPLRIRTLIFFINWSVAEVVFRFSFIF